jgi:hypothetical protein
MKLLALLGLLAVSVKAAPLSNLDTPLVPAFVSATENTP